MAGESAAGFWSYVHADDDDDGGRITNLATRLKAEYSLLTASKFELFLDRASLSWGDAWKERIDQAIAGTTFFIPIVTPRYFESNECRRELRKFTTEARRYGVEQLLLPVYYLPVPEFENDPSDDAMQLIAERQWEDLRELRLVSESSSEYRTAVNRLARRIAEIATEVSRVGSTTAVPMTDEASTAEDDMAPGIVELLAEAEQEMPKLEETMKELGRTIENFGELAEEATREMAAADARGKGFAGRLAATNRFAKRLEEPAERIENLGQLYASQLGAIDPGVHTLLDAAISEEASASEAREFFAGIHELLEESSPVMAQLSELAASLDQGARMSRALRTPVRRIQSGLKGVTDAQGIIEDWDQRAQELESALPTGLASDSDAYPPRASDISTE